MSERMGNDNGGGKRPGRGGAKRKEGLPNINKLKLFSSWKRKEEEEEGFYAVERAASDYLRERKRRNTPR